MSEPFDPGPAAGVLARAWRSGMRLSELPQGIRPSTLEQGYDVQDELMRRLGEPVAGWKLGVGSSLMKRQSGAGRSLAGRVLQSRVHRPGDVVALPSSAPVTVEFEIAYVLGRDIRPAEPLFPVLDAVAEVRTAFELVLSRFIDRRAVGWPSFVADNAAFHALVLGEPFDATRIDELRTPLVVHLDGQTAALATQGEDITDPVAALEDLVALARERGMVLPAGSIISTGSVSKPFTVAANAAHIRATFLGQELAFRTRVVPSAA